MLQAGDSVLHQLWLWFPHFLKNQQQVMGIQISQTMVQVGTAARSTVLSSTGGNSMRDNIVNVFGARLADGLVPLHAETAGGSKLEG